MRPRIILIVLLGLFLSAFGIPKAQALDMPPGYNNPTYGYPYSSNSGQPSNSLYYLDPNSGYPYNQNYNQGFGYPYSDGTYSYGNSNPGLSYQNPNYNYISPYANTYPYGGFGYDSPGVQAFGLGPSTSVAQGVSLGGLFSSNLPNYGYGQTAGLPYSSGYPALGGLAYPYVSSGPGYYNPGTYGYAAPGLNGYTGAGQIGNFPSYSAPYSFNIISR